MEWLSTLADLFLHLDRHLSDVVGRYGTGTYVLICLIIYCETGLVVTPFLPGDSLLFAAGAIAALGPLDPVLLVVLICVSAVAGDNTNYWIGRWVGPRAFGGKLRFLNRRHLDRTHAFYEKHGGKTVVLARFAPILRTFAPFVAGVGAMRYPRFLRFSIVGSLLWVPLFVLGGYFFGNLPVVRENFSLVILAIIVISLMPAAIEGLRAWRRADV
jgi:membrane-associated protein